MPALVYRPQPVRWTLCRILSRRFPAVSWSRLSSLRFEQVPVPPLPSPRWVRLRTLLGGICGTDLAAITQRHHPASILQAFASFPAVLGHEHVAVVDEVGSDVRGWSPGDRVVADSSLSCRVREIEPPCPSCAAGRFSLCDHFRTGPLPPGIMVGWNSFTGGSWSPYFVVHQSQLHAVPPAVSDEDALLVDPVAGALHGVLRHGPRDGQTVLILGGGVLGMSVAAVLRAIGSTCRVVGLVRHPAQADLMGRFGADEVVLSGRSDNQAVRYGKVAGRIGGQVVPTRFGHQAFIGGFDVVYDCIGTGQSLTDALKYARAGGTVVELGTSQITLVDTAPLWFNEINLVGANGRAIDSFEGRPRHSYEIVFELMTSGRLDVSALLTHKFPLVRYRDAFAALTRRGASGALKVAFDHRTPR